MWLPWPCLPLSSTFTVRGTTEGGGRGTWIRVTAGGAGAGSSVERRGSEGSTAGSLGKLGRPGVSRSSRAVMLLGCPLLLSILFFNQKITRKAQRDERGVGEM